MNSETERRFAVFVYRFRWVLSAVVLVLCATAVGLGGAKVAGFTEDLGALGDTTNGAGAAPPLVFDPRMDLWFGSKDEAVATYREIEDRFVAEDYVMVALEHDEHELGVFDPEVLRTVARLTERFLEIPGVRHVRSLTSNPWIRWGEIEDEFGTEEGLLISDLFEDDPASYTEDELIERMVAVLGAERVAERIGEERVRAVLGADADFADYIGEPLLLGTILDETGTTTAIQIQVLRPLVDEDVLEETFGDSDRAEVARTLYAVQAQRASLRGIEHVMRVEQGLAFPTREYERLEAWIESLPDGDEKEALRFEFSNPNRNFMANADGELVRKFHEYDDVGGAWVDSTDPANPITAPAGFEPVPLSDYEFHTGGVPLFEFNFEQVGMSDSKYMGAMFLVIALLLFIVFRNAVGVVAPMAVVFGSVATMVGVVFAAGDLFNNMTIVAPNMLTAVGIADAVHLVASWALLRHKFADKAELIVEVVRRNALPVFLTSVTTAVGFYSLTISEMVPVAMFGYTTGFGALVAYVLSMTFVPAILSLVPHREVRPESERRSFIATGWERGLSHWIFQRRGKIVVLASVLLVVSLVGTARLRIDSDFRTMFPDDNPVISDFNWIESRMGGLGDLEIVFDGAGDSPVGFGPDEETELADLRLRRIVEERGLGGLSELTAPEEARLAELERHEDAWMSERVSVSAAFLEELDRFETRLRVDMADPESPLNVMTDLTSPLDILRRMHQVQNENRAAFYRVPTEADVPEELREEVVSYDEWTEQWMHLPAQSASTMAAQYYLQYENGARPGENLATQMSMDRAQFRMQGRIVQAPSQKTVQAARLIEEIARAEFPTLGARLAGGPSTAGPELNVSGKMLLFARTNRIFTIGFVKSVSIALVVITILIGFIFRSVRIALVSLIPNMLPILIPLSFFGLFGIDLDAPAIFVASVALGVCVDDTIHFFTKFMAARRRGDTVEEAVQYTFETAGLAITLTTVILVIGFGTLMLSDFAPNFMMGTLAALMIALAWLADLIVTPAVLSYVHTDVGPGHPEVSSTPLVETSSVA